MKNTRHNRSKRSKYQFTNNQVIGAIAHMCLLDLHVNNFCFQGFPIIRVQGAPPIPKESPFIIELRLRSCKVELQISFQTASQIAQNFSNSRNSRLSDTVILEEVRAALVELEFLAQDTDDR